MHSCYMEKVEYHVDIGNSHIEKTNKGIGHVI